MGVGALVVGIAGQHLGQLPLRGCRMVCMAHSVLGHRKGGVMRQARGACGGID